jgi:hypothetical protein
LSIEYFIAIITVADSVHHIERKILPDCLDYSISLTIFVDEFTLIFWTDIEFTIISDDSFFVTIEISLSEFFDSYFFEFDFHKR